MGTTTKWSVSDDVVELFSTSAFKKVFEGWDRTLNEAIGRELNKETERGSAVLAGAYVEQELKMLVRSQFNEIPGITDGLFKGMGPLATSSAQANVAYALGVIDEDTHSELKFVRKIRNAFSHWPLGTTPQGTIEELTFDNQTIVDLMTNLKLLEKFSTLMPDLNVQFTTLRARFVSTCAILVIVFQCISVLRALKHEAGKVLDLMATMEVDADGVMTLKSTVHESFVFKINRVGK